MPRSALTRRFCDESYLLRLIWQQAWEDFDRMICTRWHQEDDVFGEGT